MEEGYKMTLEGGLLRQTLLQRHFQREQTNQQQVSKLRYRGNHRQKDLRLFRK